MGGGVDRRRRRRRQSTGEGQGGLEGEDVTNSSHPSKRSKTKKAVTTATKTNEKVTASSTSSSTFVNDYQGWTIPSPDWTIPTITLSSSSSASSSTTKTTATTTPLITPKTFFQEYVAKRRPVMLRGGCIELIRPLTYWTNEYLKSKVGETTIVMVEERGTHKDSFGQGNEIPMTFGEFLQKVEMNDSNFYLTTQDVEADDDNDDNDDDYDDCTDGDGGGGGGGNGRPDLMAPWMKGLQDDFPLIPTSLVPSLIPQNINIWMGGGGGGDDDDVGGNGENTDPTSRDRTDSTTARNERKDEGDNEREGSSSGLHHDYHDNLYFVLRGTKRFHLFSPKDAGSMKTRGSISYIHPNGRINYHGERPTTAYGADLQSDMAAKAASAKEKAEQRLILAEQAVAEGREGAQEELDAAEEEMEAAMEALLDIEMEDNDDDDDDEEEGSGDGSNDEGGDKDDDDDEEEGGSDVDDDDGNDDDDDEGEGNEDESADDYEGGPISGLLGDATSSSSNNQPFDHKTTTPPSRRLVDKTVKDPDNFSTMIVNKSKRRGTERYPETTAFSASCTVEEGDILYLPASWFHEVVSIGRRRKGQQQLATIDALVGPTTTAKGGGHMALNYWFHPPDALDNFEKPYSSDFWPNDFQQRMKKLKTEKEKTKGGEQVPQDTNHK